MPEPLNIRLPSIELAFDVLVLYHDIGEIRNTTTKNKPDIAPMHGPQSLVQSGN